MKQTKENTCTRKRWYICSDLVSVSWGNNNQTETAVLEEISPDGAVVQLECEVARQTPIRLDYSTAGFEGVVRECRYEAGLGHFATIEFSPGHRWSVEDYRPQHLLEVGDSAPQPSECNNGCGTQPWCPTQYVARAVEPRSAVDETVRRVAQNLAVVCGEMDATELARCFVHHFGAPTECVLFTKFARAYRSARENLVEPYEQPVSPLRQACNIAMLLASVPDEAFRSPVPTGAGGSH